MKRDAYSLQQVTDTLFKKPPTRKSDFGRFRQMRLVVCVAASVAVFLGALLVLPERSDQAASDMRMAVEPNAAAPTPAPVPITLIAQLPTPPSEVTRAETVLLDLPQAKTAPLATGITLSDAPISHQLRQPVRLSDRSGYAYSLNALVTETLGQLDVANPDGGALKALLVQVLAQGLSDDAIGLTLDVALARGDFTVPDALRTGAGRLDTPALLKAMVATRLAQPLQATANRPADGVHVLGANDSLAGLALMYYGQPMRFDVIAQRNHTALQRVGGLASGSTVVIPAL